ALSTERRVDRLAQVVVEQARHVASTEIAALLIQERGGLITQAVAADVAADVAGRAVSDALMQRIVADAEPVVIDDMAGHAESGDTLLRPLDVRSLLAVPI